MALFVPFRSMFARSFRLEKSLLCKRISTNRALNDIESDPRFMLICPETGKVGDSLWVIPEMLFFTTAARK